MDLDALGPVYDFDWPNHSLHDACVMHALSACSGRENGNDTCRGRHGALV